MVLIRAGAEQRLRIAQIAHHLRGEGGDGGDIGEHHRHFRLCGEGKGGDREGQREGE